MRTVPFAARFDRTAVRRAVNELATTPEIAFFYVCCVFLVGALLWSPCRLARPIAVALVLGMAGAAALAIKRGPLPTRIYRVGCVALPVVISLVALPLNWLAPYMSPLAYCTLVWCALYHAVAQARTNQTGSPAVRTPILPAKPLAAGLVLGTLAAPLLGALMGRRIASPLAIEGLIVACYALYTAGALAISELRKQTIRKAAPASDPAEIKRLSYQEACEYLSDAYLLTGRQRQVFKLISRGHRPLYISRKLFIAESTARQHVKKIYEKFDICCYEELIELVHETMAGVQVAEIRRAAEIPIPRQGRPRSF